MNCHRNNTGNASVTELVTEKADKPLKRSDLDRRLLASSAPHAAETGTTFWMALVPIPITPNRSSFLAMNWLIEAGREKDRKIVWSQQMAHELINAADNKGRVVKRKQDLHKLCEANRAYAHYRWG
ncbi:28S ribosomal protein S7, mitochondrial [Homalodisca vitripennis]|nr:28S ribosomal protein S7, mitochondrial [Homalodisca vitripennis]